MKLFRIMSNKNRSKKQPTQNINSNSSMSDDDHCTKTRAENVGTAATETETAIETERTTATSAMNPVDINNKNNNKNNNDNDNDVDSFVKNMWYESSSFCSSPVSFHSTKEIPTLPPSTSTPPYTTTTTTTTTTPSTPNTMTTELQLQSQSQYQYQYQEEEEEEEEEEEFDYMKAPSSGTQSPLPMRQRLDTEETDRIRNHRPSSPTLSSSLLQPLFLPNDYTTNTNTNTNTYTYTTPTTPTPTTPTTRTPTSTATKILYTPTTPQSQWSELQYELHDDDDIDALFDEPPKQPSKLLPLPATETETEHDDTDTASIVSSLSNDDSYQMMPTAAAAPAAHNKNHPIMSPSITLTETKSPTTMVPPTEVTIPSTDCRNKIKNIQNQQQQQDTTESEINQNVEHLVTKLSIGTQTRRVRRSHHQHHSPPDVYTLAPSPQIPRPTMGRHKSAPPDGSVMNFSYATHNSFTNSAATSCCCNNTITTNNTYKSALPPDAIVLNGGAIVAYARHSEFAGPSPPAIVGQRRRRRQNPGHRRGHSESTITVGSIVGQSSLKSAAPTMCSSNYSTIGPTVSTAEANSLEATTLTTATATATATASTNSSARLIKQSLKAGVKAERMLINYTGADEGLACCRTTSTRYTYANHHQQSRRHGQRRSGLLVKRELKYVVRRLITTPIRKTLPMLKPKKVELQRSNGTLT